MKRQIRFGVWETNSSNTNTLTIMTAEEYADYMKKWDSEDWFWDFESEEWVSSSDVDWHDDRYELGENPCDCDACLDLEVADYTTKHGDKVYAVSIYGHNY